MATTIGADATINETTSTEFLGAETGRVSVIVTNLSATDMWMARGTAAVIGQGILLKSETPFIISSDLDLTGAQNTVIRQTWNAIADTGAGAGLSIAYEVISR